MPTDEEKIRVIAREVVREEIQPIVQNSVYETLVQVGIDPSDPIVAQKRAQTVARITQLLDKGGIVAFTTLVGLVVTGVLITVWNMITK